MCPEGCPHRACAPRGVPMEHVPRGELGSGRDFSVSLPRAVSPRAAICPGGRGFPRAGFLPGLGSRPAFSMMSLTAPGSSTPELPWREVLRRPYLVRVTLRRLRGIRFFPSNDYHRMHWVAPPVPDTSFSVSLPVSVCPTPEFPWREILQSRTSSKASGDPVFFRRTTRTCSASRSPGSRSTSEFGRSNHSYICIRPQHMWYIQWRQSGQFINAHARWVLQQNIIWFRALQFMFRPCALRVLWKPTRQLLHNQFYWVCPVTAIHECRILGAFFWTRTRDTTPSLDAPPQVWSTWPASSVLARILLAIIK